MKIIQGLPRAVKAGERVGLDVELFKPEEGRLHRPTGMFACLSIAVKDGPSTYTTYQIRDASDVGRVLQKLGRATWVLHNGLFDIRQMRRWATVPKRQSIDTMILERDLFGGWYDSFALDDVTRRWLGQYLDKSVRKQFLVQDELTPAMSKYAALDALTTLRVAEKQLEYAKERGDPLHCYWEIDEPAMWAILDMPPIKIDVDGWLKLAERMDMQVKSIKEKLGFNPGSPKQCQEKIFQVVG